MYIQVVDGSAASRSRLTRRVRQLGHRVQAHANLQAALAVLSDAIDLVVVRVGALGQDGASLAAQIAARLGTCPPRCLLLDDRADGHAATPGTPAQVIAVMTTPQLLRELRTVLGFLERTRRRCPGWVTTACPEIAPQGAWTDLRPPPPRDLCATSDYSGCREFRQGTGQVTGHLLELL